MKTRRLILLAACLVAGVATAQAPLRHLDREASIPGPSRTAIYCQDPDYVMVYGMSSGFDAEFADDIPHELAGETVTSVVLWFGEWYSGGSQGWREPVGLRLNLYHEQCPPELDPYRTIEVAWTDLEKTLVEATGSRWVYEVRVPLDPALVVEPGMSLGATALIDWGQDEPFCGLVATPFWVSYGDCPAYLDGANWGYVRWTAIDHFTTIMQDLAYCLEGLPTAVPAADTATPSLSAHPNPFNPRTTIRTSLTIAGPVTLRVHDAAGRVVATLTDEWRNAGELLVDWHGVDDAGRSVSTGTYFVTLATGGRHTTTKVSVLK